jgi:hypothetical protein
MVSIGIACGELRERILSRSRQFTGWICVLRHYDLVKEIGQTCGRSATVRLAQATSQRSVAAAAKHLYSTSVFLYLPGGVTRLVTLAEPMTKHRLTILLLSL